MGSKSGAIAERCVWVQNGTTREVVNQLRAISKQQSRIRLLRDSIAGLKAVTTQQAEHFAELLLVRRIPAAYRQALAEVARRCEDAASCSKGTACQGIADLAVMNQDTA